MRDTTAVTTSPESASRAAQLTTGRQLTRSVAWNIAAQALPLAVAVVCIPLTIERAGVDRFGLLMLAWALIGYSGLFDFGLGRAVTHAVAKLLGAGDESAIPSTAWTGLALIAAVGLVGAALLFLLAPWLATTALNVPVQLQPEATDGFRAVAFSVPVVTLTAGLRGILEAYQRFRTIAVVSTLMGSLTFAGPLLVLGVVEADAAAMVVALVAARLLGAIAYGAAVLRTTPGIMNQGPDRRALRPLVRFGSWMTLTNVLGPLMDNMDRFIIGAMLSVNAVAYYATPFDVVNRLRVLPTALVGVLFPALSTSLVAEKQRAFKLYEAGIRHLILVMTPPVLLLVIFAEDGLRFWLGGEFAQNSTTIVRWLALGALINAVATVPYATLQAAGRPDVTSRLHLLELPLYLITLWLFVSAWGVAGAAAAWTLRVSLDAVLLLCFSHRLLQLPWRSLRSILAAAAVVTAIVVAAFFVDASQDKVLYLLAASFVYGVLANRVLLMPGELARTWAHFRSTK